jgi:SWI/SNF-related matrix-associated actin-dependent regulator 1 of chromatin subfamily A
LTLADTWNGFRHIEQEIDMTVASSEIKLEKADKGLLRMAFEYDPDLVSFVKNTFEGRRFDGATKSWLVPATPKNLNRIREHAGYFHDGAETLRSFEEQQQSAIQASAAFHPSPEFRVRPGLGGELRPYQVAGVEFVTVFAKNRAYIGDEMGLGKTITALAVLHHNNSYPALIIAPSSLLGNWKREAEKWLPGKKIQLFLSGKTVLDTSADIVIVSYALADKVGGHFRQLIVDESHYVKNHTSQRSKAVKSIAQSVPNLLFLSGTPISRAPKDLFAQLDILGVAGKGKTFGDWWSFTKRYCDGKDTRFGYQADGATNIEELASLLRASVYLRRDKSQVLKDLPEKQRQFLYVPLAAEAKAELREIEKKRREDKAAGVAGADMQAATASFHAIGRGKAEAAEEFVAEFADTGKKLIVFANQIALQNRLFAKAQELGLQPAKIQGEDSAMARDAAVQRFQTDPDCKVIVCSLKAAGVGLTLTAASDVLMVEQDFVPATLDQAEDRAHRIGQRNAVNVVYLIAEKTIDEQVAALVEGRRKTAADLSKPITADLIKQLA